MAAFANGLALGSDGIECDVHLSRDGIPVVIHDKTLDRTTDATGPVARADGQRAGGGRRRLSLRPEGDGFPFRGRGIGVPDARRGAAAFAGVRVIIEMKQGDPALARAVAGAGARHRRALERVCVGSFYRRGLDVIRAEAPEIATSASEDEARWTLYRSWCRWPLRSQRVYSCVSGVRSAPGGSTSSPRRSSHQAHRDGARVDVWVVDAAEEIERLFALGVDGVITDRPDMAVSVRDRMDGADSL